MSLLPKNCDGWSTTREYIGPRYVSPFYQRPTLSSSAFYRWHLCSLSSDVTDGLLCITSALQQDLDDLSQRPAANKMVTNAAKTKCLLMNGKRLTNQVVDSLLNLYLGNSNIEQVDCQKLLGLTTDRHLSFHIHVEELCKKLSQRKAVLRKIRRFLPIEQRV